MAENSTFKANGGGVNPKNGVNGKVLKKHTRKRVTFVLPPELDQLLEMYCTSTNQLKNTVVTDAIIERLSREKRRLQDALESTSDALNRLAPPADQNRRT